MVLQTYFEYLAAFGSIPPFGCFWIIWIAIMGLYFVISLIIFADVNAWIKQRILEQNGILTTGIIMKRGRTSEYPLNYKLVYVFNTIESNTSFLKRRFLFIDAYSRDITNTYLPSSIINVILSFHGHSKYGSNSIISSAEIDYFPRGSLHEFQIGDKIKIIYDPSLPKLWNDVKCMMDRRSVSLPITLLKMYMLYSFIFILSMITWCIITFIVRSKNGDKYVGVELISCILCFITLCGALGLAALFCFGCCYFGKNLYVLWRYQKLMDHLQNGGFKKIEDDDLMMINVID